MKKVIAILFVGIMLLGFVFSVSAAAINAEDTVKISFDKPELNETVVLVRALEYIDATYEPNSGARPDPESDGTTTDGFAIWMNSPFEIDSYVAYELDIKTAGTYEIILIGTAQTDPPARGIRGIGWRIDDGQKYQVDIEPILVPDYEYATLSYKYGYISNITFELTAGKHILYTFLHEDYITGSSGGRLNFAGFYYQKLPDPEVIEETVVDVPAEVVTEAPATKPVAPQTGDTYILYLLAGLAMSAIMMVSKLKRKQI